MRYRDQGQAGRVDHHGDIDKRVLKSDNLNEGSKPQCPSVLIKGH